MRHRWSPHGPPSVRDVEADRPEDLLALAEREDQRAAEAMRRAAEYRTEALRWQDQLDAEAERAAAQRRERAAITRARRADPFGLNVLADHPLS